MTSINICDKIFMHYNFLTNTNMHSISKKLLTGALAAGMMISSVSSFASNIGSGTVVGSGALTTNVVWNDTFPGTATGIVNGLQVRARILPILNFVITGSGVINLGNLSSTAAST